MIQKVNGILLFFEKSGSGRPLLLIHGNGEDHEIFDRLVTELEKTYTVYAIDSRGHGKSSDVEEFHYDDMVRDIVSLIEIEKLEKPILYGFSDGGIVGLLLASNYPSLLSKLIISGANSHPTGLKIKWQLLFHFLFLKHKDSKIKLLLTEPNITREMLEKIEIPVLILAGQHDMVKKSDTVFIAKHIRFGELKIVANEDHSSYVVHSEKLYPLLEMFLES